MSSNILQWHPALTSVVWVRCAGLPWFGRVLLLGFFSFQFLIFCLRCFLLICAGLCCPPFLRLRWCSFWSSFLHRCHPDLLHLNFTPPGPCQFFFSLSEFFPSIRHLLLSCFFHYFHPSCSVIPLRLYFSEHDSVLYSCVV